MKTQFKLLFLFVCISHIIHAQPSLDWAQNIGTIKSDNGRAITVDNQSNIFSSGIINDGSYCFIFKQNSQGDTIWSTSFGNFGSNISGGPIVVDHAQNVYLLGSATNAISFPTSTGVFNLPNFGYRDIFVCKYDSAGVFQWARLIYGNNNDGATGMDVDFLGNIYITGVFAGSINFDTYQGTLTYYSASNGQTDIFLCKMDPNGIILWVKKFGGVGADGSSKLRISPDNKIVFAGYINSSFDFDPGPGIYYVSGSFQGFISRFDTSGNFIDVNFIGGLVSSLDIDSKGNILTTGRLWSSGDFDPGPGTYILTAGGSITSSNYVCKWSASCTFKWAIKIGGPYESTSCIAIDVNDNVFFAGQYTNAIDMNPGPGTYMLYPSGEEDGFICKLDSNASFLYAFKIGSTYHDRIDQIHISNSGKIGVIGTFTTQVDMDPGPATFNLLSNGQTDIFIAQYDDPLASGIALLDDPKSLFQIYPNPASGRFRLWGSSLNNKSIIEVVNLLGEKVSVDINYIDENYEITLQNPKPGLYLVRINDGIQTYTGKILISP